MNTSLETDFNCTELLNLMMNLNYEEVEAIDAARACEDFLPPHFEDTHSEIWWPHQIVRILYGITFVVGLPGNALVIYVVSRFSELRTSTNWYILNLAVAHVCFLVGLPFLLTTAHLGYWPFGNLTCKAYFTSTSINQMMTTWFLVIMAADSYLAVGHPFTAPKYRTPCIAIIVAVITWIFTALITAPIFMYANTLEIEIYEMVSCNIFWPDTDGWTGETIIYYTMLTGFAVPVVLLTIFCVLLIRELCTNDGMGSFHNPMSSNESVASKQAGKLVVTVAGAHVLCWTPYWIIQVCLINLPQETMRSEAKAIAFIFSECLSYLNSAMNPIIYAVLSESFRTTFHKACCCVSDQGSNEDERKATMTELTVVKRPEVAGSEASERLLGCD